MIDEIAQSIAKQLWAAAQAIEMEIAHLPLDRRKAAFAACEKGLHDVGHELRLPLDRDSSLVKIQMEAIPKMVAEIDAGNSQELSL
jgi:hypothetical protein